MAEEATAVNPEPAAQPAAPAPAPEDNKPVATASPANDTGEYSADDVKPQPQSETTDKPAGDTPNEPRGAEKRKEQLKGEIQDLQKQAGIDPNTEIRDLVSVRNALKQHVEQANAKAYRPATEQQLLDQINPDTGDYYSPLEARVKVMGDSQQMSAYNDRVAETQLVLGNEAERALRDFPMFDPMPDAQGNPTNPNYRADIAAMVDNIMATSLVFDPNTGQVIGSSQRPYQLYQAFHETYAQSTTDGRLQGQRATEQMLASADNVGGAPQPSKGFDSMTLDEKRAYLRAKGHDV